MILLRNQAVAGAGGSKALPLRKGKVTAVLGPLANATLALASRYYDAVCPGRMNASLPFGHGERASGCIRSPLAQLAARGHTVHEPGIPCADDHPANHCVGNNSTASFAAAIKAAQQADQIVFFVGLDHTQETEGTDRQQLSLPGAQQPLLEAVRKAVPGKPITVVLLNGGAVSMDSLAAPATHPVADALVEAFFPGVEGGEALACALYGDGGCNRWGRLPVTVFPSSFAKNDMANMGISTGGSGMRTYKYYKEEFGKPTFRFGSGLSYVPFSLAWSDAAPSPPSVISPAQSDSVSVATKNLGDREGDQVLLLYWVGGPSANLTGAGPGVPDECAAEPAAGRVQASAS
jgi:beta-glucosidase